MQNLLAAVLLCKTAFASSPRYDRKSVGHERKSSVGEKGNFSSRVSHHRSSSIGSVSAGLRASKSESDLQIDTGDQIVKDDRKANECTTKSHKTFFYFYFTLIVVHFFHKLL